MDLGNRVEQQLHQDVMTYWTNFYRTGDPGIDERGLAQWPKFGKERNTLVLQEHLTVIQEYKQQECDFWDLNTPVSKDAIFGIPSGLERSASTGDPMNAIWTGVLIVALFWHSQLPFSISTRNFEPEASKRMEVASVNNLCNCDFMYFEESQ
eukprot:TRINITY_DN807_c0_g1_i1.p1 TRINITY_DN807_c0_g1~~TRINITY_DN807_c0_g1_i1.p1  ORF type:complete len:152 (-),score=32.01 TRINITY_DN807_c0_g1_i1:80-535(-)